MFLVTKEALFEAVISGCKDDFTNRRCRILEKFVVVSGVL